MPTETQTAMAKQLINQDNSQPVFACIARLSEEKGIDVLLQSVAKLKAGGYNFHCYIVGDGPQSAFLKNLSNQLALDDMVHFVGWQENIAAIITNVDFLVLPSRSEGLGLVVLEGLLQAKPTVASHVGGIPEIIQNGKTGVLVPPNDPAALAEAIIKMLLQPEWVHSLGLAGQQTVVQNYSVAQMVA